MTAAWPSAGCAHVRRQILLVLRVQRVPLVFRLASPESSAQSGPGNGPAGRCRPEREVAVAYWYINEIRTGRKM